MEKRSIKLSLETSQDLNVLRTKTVYSLVAGLIAIAGPGCLFLDSHQSVKAGSDMTDMPLDMGADAGSDMTDMPLDMGADAGSDMTDMSMDMGADAGSDMTDMSMDMGTDAGSDMTDMSMDMGTDASSDMTDMPVDMDPCTTEMKGTKMEIIRLIDKSRETLLVPNNVNGSMYGNFNFVCNSINIPDYERGTAYDANLMRATNRAVISTADCNGHFRFEDGALGNRGIIEGYFSQKDPDKITVLEHGYHPAPSNLTDIPNANATTVKYSLDYQTGELKKDDLFEMVMCDRIAQEIINY